MFGTVTRVRLKEGVSIDELKAQFNVEDRPASSLALIALQSVDDPREVWLASAFESRDAYFKNADSPEQNARFERMRALVEDGPPEWHDGNVVVLATERGVRATT